MKLFIKEFYKSNKCHLVKYRTTCDPSYLAIQDAITGYYVNPIKQTNGIAIIEGGFDFRESPWYFEINKIERIKAMLNYES